jgi:hypothetical protein
MEVVEMTTATAPTLQGPPTEAEIRETIRARLERFPSDDPRDQLRSAIEDIAGILTGPAYDALESPDPREPDGNEWPLYLWSSDLRPSEAAILKRHGEAAEVAAFDRALAVIIDEVVAAALAAGQEGPQIPRAPRAAGAVHPDAPRAVR